MFHICNVQRLSFADFGNNLKKLALSLIQYFQLQFAAASFPYIS
jgi:hypothetical protein